MRTCPVVIGSMLPVGVEVWVRVKFGVILWNSTHYVE